MTFESGWIIRHPEEFADVRRKLACLSLHCEPIDVSESASDSQEKLRANISKAIKGFQENSEFRERYPVLTRAAPGVCDYYTWDAIKDAAGILFSEAAQWELDRLSEPRPPLPGYTIPTAHAVNPAVESQVRLRAHRSHLWGLAFSGGGIRSATFNLGVLQGLAEFRLLRCVDFLSTVSGGSYIGSWLSAWISRQGGDVVAVEEQLDTKRQKPEADPIKTLRQYSNFMTPKVGLFGADTWTVIATWLRNMILNFVILTSLIAFAMLIPRLLAMGIHWFLPHGSNATTATTLFTWGTGLGGLGLYLWAVFIIGLNLTLLPSKDGPGSWLVKQWQGNVLWRVILPLLISGFALSIWLWMEREEVLKHVNFVNPWSWENLFKIIGATLFYLVIWGSGWYYAIRQNRINFPDRPKKVSFRKELIPHLSFSICAFLFGSLLISLTLSIVGNLHNTSLAVKHTSHLVVWGVPVMLSIFGLVMVLLIGLIGRAYNDRSREWWSRMGGWLTVFVIGWIIITSISLYSPGLFAWLHAWASSTLTIGWILTTVGGVMMGSSSLTAKAGSSRALERFVSVAPYVFILGMLVAISVIAQQLLSGNSACANMKCNGLTDHLHYALVALEETDWSSLIISMTVLIVVSVLLGWRVDINKFSLYMMYRNRLVRAYLGASKAQRNPHPFTGFDEADDIALRDILSPDAGKPMQRPYHIINGALNLVKSGDLAWQERKAAAFAFTPAFCGYEMPKRPRNENGKATTAQARGCYRPTLDYQRPESGSDEESGVKIGQALTISGAAASPSMGYHSSPALTFLMTLFNVRLGRWCANPRGDRWREPSPRSGMKSLLYELFGLTDASADFLYLSDGGHFENLGIYELVRRRCKLIIAIDATEDDKSSFNDLGDSIRKCYTDFGIPIDINVNKIRTDNEEKISKSHYAIGIVHYEDADVGTTINDQGVLLYIKSSLTGNEPADILNYAKREISFPNQSTSDQWFDESQFESYRKLGHHIAKAVLEEFNVNSNPAVPCEQKKHALIATLKAKLKTDPAPALVSQIDTPKPDDTTQ